MSNSNPHEVAQVKRVYYRAKDVSYRNSKLENKEQPALQELKMGTRNPLLLRLFFLMLSLFSIFFFLQPTFLYLSLLSMYRDICLSLFHLSPMGAASPKPS